MNAFIDNQIRSKHAGPCVGPRTANHLFAGNTFTVANPVAAGNGRVRHLDQKIVPPDELPVPTTLRLPGPPRRAPGKVFEIRAGTGDDAAEIQKQIDAAAAEKSGAVPIIHLPKGKWTLRRDGGFSCKKFPFSSSATARANTVPSSAGKVKAPVRASV